MRHLKLLQPERPRIRVRALAREVGLPDAELLTWLRTKGEWTKSVGDQTGPPRRPASRSSRPCRYCSHPLTRVAWKPESSPRWK